MLKPKRPSFIIALVVFMAAAAMFSASAWAGHKCPNRYFKKVPATGNGDSEVNATQAYKDDAKKQADKAKDDCKGCECDETAETCTFKYTYKTKPKCKDVSSGGITAWQCKGWIRPGCFCMEDDEDFLAVSAGGATSEAAAAASSEKKKE